MQRHTAIALAQATLVALILLWFTSIMIDCDSILSRACDAQIWQSWLDLWRLGWIKQYKELIAGILAAGAGAFALIAVRLQITSEQNARRKHHIEAIRGAIGMIAADFNRAIMTLSRKASDKTADMRFAVAALPKIAEVDSSVAGILMTAIHATELALIEDAARPHEDAFTRVRSALFDNKQDALIRDGWLHAAAAGSFLRGGGLTVGEDGAVVLKRVNANRYRSIASRFKVPDSKLPMRELFLWDNDR